MERVFLGLGSNKGDKLHWLRFALEGLSRCPRTRIVRVSSLYRTAPWGVAEQEDYYNAVAELATELPPRELLAAAQRIEALSGRERPYRWAPRELDIDILLYGGLQLATEELTIPHPRMRERRFVLLPLAEIAPELVLPDGTAVGDLLQQTEDQEVEPFFAANKWIRGKENEDH